MNKESKLDKTLNILESLDTVHIHSIKTKDFFPSIRDCQQVSINVSPSENHDLKYIRNIDDINNWFYLLEKKLNKLNFKRNSEFRLEKSMLYGLQKHYLSQPSLFSEEKISDMNFKRPYELSLPEHDKIIFEQSNLKESTISLFRQINVDCYFSFAWIDYLVGLNKQQSFSPLDLKSDLDSLSESISQMYLKSR